MKKIALCSPPPGPAGRRQCARPPTRWPRSRTRAPPPWACASLRARLSYTLGDGKYAGFHVEICQRVLADVQKKLGLAKLDIKYQPVTSQNRIPLVQNGTVDIECGSTTNNATRQKDVSFAVTTYVEEVRIAVKANSGITSIAQLNGKNVATTTGTTSVQLLRKHERAAGVDFKEVFGKDHADSFLLLETGRADAFVMDGQILAGNIAKQEPGRLQDRRRSALGGAHRHHDPQGRPGLQEGSGRQHRGDDEVRRDRQAVRQVVRAAHPAQQHPCGPACQRSHQGGLGQPERQAGRGLRQEVGPGP
jgi:ABC-type amino acid transport substrate-binding protein